MTIAVNLEKNNIATRETLEIFAGSVLFYLASLALFGYHFYCLAWCTMLMVVGALANLYVIDFNNRCMPVININRKELDEARKSYPTRRFCKLNKNTKLAWLADRFKIGRNTHSLGDFFIYVGSVGVVLYSLVVILIKPLLWLV